ncbi:MAG: TIGR00730 family Rossman fold protein [Firmicutes bacterium]|nr:TIGR00730 family Rossman fold protein [Bacillota bacterium]
MKICMYGASSTQLEKIYYEKAEDFGILMASRGHGLVFGGGATGLMGAAVHGVSSVDGYSLGIAPKFFDEPGILYNGCSDFIFTETMRERKQLMEDHADAFVMLPGGIGTYEEFFEILTLKQLGRHNKPIAVYNINGYYDLLDEMLQHTVNQKFMTAECLNLYGIFDDAKSLLDYIEHDGI